MTKIRQPVPARLAGPRQSARVNADESASVLAQLIASRQADTQADLVRATGLARTAVSAGVERLFGIGLLEVAGRQRQTGRGRPGELLQIAATFGVVAAVEIDLDHTSIAIYDFGQRTVGRGELEVSLADSPDATIGRVAAAVLNLISNLTLAPLLRVAVIGVGAPIDVLEGRISGPPIMAEWNRFPLTEALEQALSCTVIIRNDCDLRALGDARHLPLADSPLVHLRVSRGIGIGYVDRVGELVTGFDGAAGQISHMRAREREGRLCMCGGTDHLQSYGSEIAMLKAWTESDPRRVNDSYADFEHQLRQRHPVATQIAVSAAREIGHCLAEVLLVLNPAHVTIGGRLMGASDAILSTIRSVVFEVGLPLATRSLLISQSPLGEDAGLRGALVMALDQALAADEIGSFRMLPKSRM